VQLFDLRLQLLHDFAVSQSKAKQSKAKQSKAKQSLSSAEVAQAVAKLT
jgi:hypothetical protein